jgi:16S rRNA processing protein RimM
LRTSRIHKPHRKIPRTPPRRVREAHVTAAPPPAPAKPAEPSPEDRKPQRAPDEGFVAVGRVLAPFGIKGELKVQPLTDNPRRFAPKSRIWAGKQKVTIVGSRQAQGAVFIKLKGFHDRTSVEGFRHALLQIPETDLPPLDPGEFYRYQLIGLAVVDLEGNALGTLEEIIETGANDVYRVRTASGDDLLLPALDDVVVSIDLEARRMIVDPPPWR